jgi:7-keto-8-aminopelargonate synthetase-like enzyme
VVTDTVFSMDGDIAPLERIAAACREAGALLILDEAHAVLGPEPGPEVTEGLAVLRVGTLSKTLGAVGGFVAGTRAAVSLLENSSRSYIFTTAPSPADAAGALAAVEIVQSAEGDRLRGRLIRNVQRLAPNGRTPIVPIILGSEERALQASHALLEQGIWVPAIRPPTVPAGTARLRVTFSATHAPIEVTQLCAALAALVPGSIPGSRLELME